MNRRRALVIAGTLAGSLAMGGTAMAVNLGMLDTNDDDPVGNLDATEIQPVEDGSGVRVIDQTVPAPAGGTSGSGTSVPGSGGSDDGPGHDPFDDHGGDRDDDDSDDDDVFDDHGGDRDDDDDDSDDDSGHGGDDDSDDDDDDDDHGDDDD